MAKAKKSKDTAKEEVKPRDDEESEGGEDVLEGEIENTDDDPDLSKLPIAKAQRASDGRGTVRYDAMTSYLREVQRHPLLTPEETHELAVKFTETQDPVLAAKMVTANLRLVVKIAYEYRRAYKNIMDLVQEGNIGLMQAVKRYDPYRGVKLSSYSAWWIRAYILRFILNNWRLVKLGTTQAQRKLFFNLRKKKAELEAMGISATPADIARELNVTEDEVREMDTRLGASEKSLDAPVGGEGDDHGLARIDLMPSAVASPEILTAGEELQTLMKGHLAEFRKTLVDKEKDLAIFDERLVAEEPLTLQELGERFHISRERVRQLEQRITSQLKTFLEEKMGDVSSLTA